MRNAADHWRTAAQQPGDLRDLTMLGKHEFTSTASAHGRLSPAATHTFSETEPLTFCIYSTYSFLTIIA
jgi:hypothetical protein